MLNRKWDALPWNQAAGLAAFLLISLPALGAASAQEFKFEFPRTGKWVELEFETGNGMGDDYKMSVRGRIVVRCLENEYIQMDSCRWMEVHYFLTDATDTEYETIYKFLIPEVLDPDRDPLEQIHRTWFVQRRQGNEQPEQIVLSEKQVKPLLLTLLTPEKFSPENRRGSKTYAVTGQEVECAAYHFQDIHQEDNDWTRTFDCVVHTCPDVPFGMVHWQADHETVSSTGLTTVGRMYYKLVDSGDDCRSALPDYK